MKKIFVAFLILRGTLIACAQHASITDIHAMGYMLEFDELDRHTKVNLVAKVKLTYDHIGEGQAGCFILVNNQRLPIINSGNELLANTQKLSYGSEDLAVSVDQKTTELEISLPMDERLNGKEEILYAQAFVLYGEENPKLLAKSNVVNINPKVLKPMEDEIDTEVDTEDVTEKMKRKMIGGILGDVVRNPSAIDENGFKVCSACHGSGTIRDDSYNHAEERESGRPRAVTTTTCEYCGGAGKVKATEADYEMNRAMGGLLDAGGVSNDALYDIFTNGSTGKGKSKKSEKQSSGKSKKKNTDPLNSLLEDYFGF